MYKSIHLNSKEISNYQTSTGNKEIENLSKINIFIGPNNSGKSRFLRGLFSDPNPEFKIESIELKKLNSAIMELKNKLENYFKDIGVNPVGQVKIGFLKEIAFLSNVSHLKNDLYDKIYNLSQIDFNGIGMNGTVNRREVKKGVDSFVKTCLDKMNSIKSFNINDIKRENIYIPTLRGLRGIDYEFSNKLRGQDNYSIRTKADYFPDIENIETKIFTGLSLYADVKKHLLGSYVLRVKINQFEDFISSTFFDNKGFQIIPHIDDNVVHVKIGDDDDFPIYNLGDGIQSIIILTYPLFFNQGKNLSVFYEEPDMFLHPGLQRVFLETISLPIFKSFQFYLTTHSNHFLDMTLDFDSVSIYTFQKTNSKEFFIENVENDDNKILQILGVRNSSVLLSNCTIWVEGITDRIYIRKFLKLYQETLDKVFLEDKHYSFVEYGGGNITHWSFLDDSDTDHPNIDVEKLCAKLFLITDQDGAGLKKDGNESKKKLRQKRLEEKLGENYYCLQSREIENLLPENIIINVIKEYENDEENKIDFNKIKLSSYKDKLLGKFIDDKAIGKQRLYSAESGTIKDKVNFAKKAVNYMNDYDSLSDEAKTLTERIYEFIKKNNL
jgi:predicted ATP-dependent endonuclease of OLD family